jgi:hypothetical protein
VGSNSILAGFRDAGADTERIAWAERDADAVRRADADRDTGYGDGVLR